MTQEIKIPVSAQVDARGLDKLDDAVSGVGEATRAVARDAKDAAAAFGQMEIAARRLASTKAMLERELGRSVSASDAGRFQDNFDRMRKSRGIGASRLKAFDDVDGWYHGHSSTFTNQAHASAHRRFIVARGMQGTNDSFEHGGPAGPGGPPEGGGAGGGGGGGAVRSAAWGMVKGAGMIGLGLAGISSISGMAGKGMTNAVSEAESIDGLKRRMGDLGVDFLNLREQARQAGVGLGITYVESARLALEFGKEAGRLRSGDMKGMGLRDDLRVGMGLSRSYGMDPGVGVQFSGAMRRLGVTQDDQGSRRLALQIADAIEKGGFIGKAEEVLRAVSNYAVQSANFSLTTPNVGSYMAGLASLMGTGAPGLDPAGAANLLATADGNVRRGGARGEASMNFTYAALSGGKGGMNPVTAMALAEGGMFGTTAGTFHDPKSALAQYYAKNNLKRPEASEETNFDKMMPLLRKSYGNGEYLLDAMRGEFGLTLGQSAALAMMQDKGILGKSEALLKANGIDPMKVSGTGLQSVAKITNASSGDALKGVYDDIMGRRDIKEADKKNLAGAAQSAAATGDFGAMQSALLKAVASADQEKDVATETRDSVKAIDDALTKAGSPILAALNPMRMALEALASTIAPYSYNMAKWEAERAEKGVRIGHKPEDYGEVGWGNIGGTGPAPPAGAGGGSASSREAHAMQRFMGLHGLTKAQAAGVVGNLTHESVGLNTSISGDGGLAFGIAQWHPDRQAGLEKFARSKGKPARDFDTQLDYVMHELKTEPRYGLAALKSSTTPGEAAAVFGLKFERPAGAQTGVASNIHGYRNRVSNAERLYGAPLPADAKHGFNGASGPRVEFGDAKVIIQDQNGKTRGTAKLKPVAKPTPSGGFPVRAGAY